MAPLVGPRMDLLVGERMDPSVGQGMNSLVGQIMDSFALDVLAHRNDAAVAFVALAVENRSVVVNKTFA